MKINYLNQYISFLKNISTTSSGSIPSVWLGWRQIK